MAALLCLFSTGCSITSITERATLDRNSTAAISPQTIAAGDTEQVSDDNVWLWEVRHLPTPALPNGRLGDKV